MVAIKRGGFGRWLSGISCLTLRMNIIPSASPIQPEDVTFFVAGDTAGVNKIR